MGFKQHISRTWQMIEQQVNDVPFRPHDETVRLICNSTSLSRLNSEKGLFLVSLYAEINPRFYRGLVERGVFKPQKLLYIRPFRRKSCKDPYIPVFLYQIQDKPLKSYF